ncbi:serine/threonine-protein phosphatase [Streptomyces sp. NBC_00080]|uniref:PP2C family protein-serine/threonine phosphatase n=1 Tax=Streptomyces sp. NBC_00080 TaxID=2975645 RepID=UPI00324C4BC3
MFGIRRPLRRALPLGLPTAWGALAITYKLSCPSARQDGLLARIVTSAVFFAVGTGLILHMRQALVRELEQARRVAGAAQSVVLRPPPPRVDGLNVAAAQLSADRGASVGGDLYEVIATEHGVRVVMGDVRGHGLPALGTVAALLGSFREAAHDEHDLGRVLRRLERALERHLRERARDTPDATVAEEFVTVLVLEIREDGELHVLNCGHPWPYLLSGTSVRVLSRADPLPPLGPFPLPVDLSPMPCGRLLRGESVVLFTDGAEDARDTRGRFFSLSGTLEKAVRDHPVTAQQILRAVLTALLRHTAAGPTDDIAVLVLRNGRLPAPTSGARGTARPATTHPQPTTHR